MSHYQKAEFICSAHELRHLPPDDGIEIAFAGRSNAGKSSAINTITNQKSLARTSKTPGRTQQIVFFKLDEQRHLVDLPGYGYAKVPVSVKLHWQQSLERYLNSRASLKGLCLIMDCRHPLTEFDQQMLFWSKSRGMPVHVLLTKADKLSRNQATSALMKVRNHLQKLSPQMSVQLFSSLKRTGVEEAHQMLDHWFAW